ncbi:MAG TPA: MaoC family dehydratase [Candidatus Aquirickettsiella sp.]|jgi:itaconyl-CoA hydratase
MRDIKQINENTFRSNYGRYYEDFEIGHIYQHRPGRTITETDNIWFSLLTMNKHPLHIDNEYGKNTEFRRTIVASGFTVSILGGMSVSDISQKAIANLGWSDIKMPAPLFAGDTLYGESQVLQKRESKSRSNAGIVLIKTWGKNQNGIVVCEYKRSVLVPKRGHAVEDSMDY